MIDTQSRYCIISINKYHVFILILLFVENQTEFENSVKKIIKFFL